MSPSAQALHVNHPHRPAKANAPKVKKLAMRACNICGKSFKPHSRFERFCENCHTSSEVYHYSEWLPHVS